MNKFRVSYKNHTIATFFTWFDSVKEAFNAVVKKASQPDRGNAKVFYNPVVKEVDVESEEKVRKCGTCETELNPCDCEDCNNRLSFCSERCALEYVRMIEETEHLPKN